MNQIKGGLPLAVALAVGIGAGSILDKNPDPELIKLERLSSVKVVANGETRYVVSARLPDGGDIQILEQSSACSRPDPDAGDRPDCLCDSADAGPRWIGHNVCYGVATGSQCIPSACRAIYGFEDNL